MEIVSALDDPNLHNLAQQLVGEYVEATAQEMGVDPAIFLPHIEGYAEFPGVFSQGGDFILALLNNEPAGCVGVKRIEADRFEIKSLFVRKNYRGRGVARRLTQETIRIAQRLGYTRLELDVLTSRVGAIKLYRKLGFVQCTAHHDYDFEMVGFELLTEPHYDLGPPG